MRFNRFKNYSSNDQQQDLFGAANWQYVKQLHHQSKQELKSLWPLMTQYVLSRLLGRKVSFDPQALNQQGLAIDPEQGRLLYSMVYALKPDVVFEYGTSFGLSALYIAKALKDIGKGIHYGTEIEPQKIKKANANIARLQLNEHFCLIEGNILENAQQFPNNINMVLMDGFPDLNLKVLQNLEPHMADGCLVITDDVNLFRREMREYLEYLQSAPHYSHQEIPISDGFAFSVKRNSRLVSDSPSAAEDAAVAQLESFSKNNKI